MPPRFSRVYTARLHHNTPERNATQPTKRKPPLGRKILMTPVIAPPLHTLFVCCWSIVALLVLLQMVTELKNWCRDADGSYDVKKGTQLLTVYSLEIQMQTELKDYKTLKVNGSLLVFVFKLKLSFLRNIV